jgi:hypothetical protein
MARDAAATAQRPVTLPRSENEVIAEVQNREVHALDLGDLTLDARLENGFDVVE